MEYYSELKKPNDFRYKVIINIKECLLLQLNQEKLELIRQSKKDIIAEITNQIKELNKLINELDLILTDEEIKKEIEKETQPINTKTTQTKKQTTQKQPTQPTKITSQEKIDILEYTLNKIEQKLQELKQ